MGSITIQIKNNERKSEQGNVLFLILIAVALFAALSYAVTQSTRSGGGSADREKSILSSASMTQYPAGLRTSAIRMILAGTPVDSMLFNSPSNFSVNVENEVFHPRGGGALFQNAPADLMATGGSGTWSFNANFIVPEIGIDDAGGDGADLIAFLPGVSSSICERLNQEFSVDGTNCTMRNGSPEVTLGGDNVKIAENISTLTGATSFDDQAAASLELEGDGATCKALASQPSACFYETGLAQYVFYSSILER